MAWNVLTSQDVLDEMSPGEVATIKAIQEAADLLPRFVQRAVNECRGAIAAGSYPLGPDATVPDGLHSDVIAIARWRWLISLPQLSKMQTKEREQAFKDAQAKLKQITQQDYAPESPADGSSPKSGNWNSENKLLPRTHPVPPPATQFQSTSDAAHPYANPDGPKDE